MNGNNEISDELRAKIAEAEEKLDGAAADRFKRAESGDILEAKEVLLDLLLWLDKDSEKHLFQHNPQAKNMMFIPDYAREYLKKALWRICKGEDANRAFNLKKDGHQKWRWENRRGGAYIVHQLICQGDSVLEATGMAEELIRNHIAELQGRPTPYAVLEGVKADTLQKWYYEFKEELQRTFPKELFTKPD